MRGKKEIMWAVAVSAALVTAGLILSCGDDDGGVAVDCQAACENLKECGFIPDFMIKNGFYFGETVGECVEACEDELAGGGGDFAAMYECVTDAGCADILDDCLCPTYCEKLDECDLLEMFWGTMESCLDTCGADGFLFQREIVCVIGASSCNLIWDRCML
jgi:hypothetical protein